jgi:hypothetical protein
MQARRRCERFHTSRSYFSSAELPKNDTGKPVKPAISVRSSALLASPKLSDVSGASNVDSKSMFCIFAHSASNKPSKLCAQHHKTENAVKRARTQARLRQQ